MYELILFTGILFADRLTKLIVPRFLDLHQTIPVIPSFFQLTYVRNSGGAFGILAGWDSPLRRIFFITASILAVALLVYLFRQARLHSTMAVRLCLAGIGAGALGNLYDRATTGEVVDFLDFFVGSYHWPAFNVADSSISVSVAVLIYLHLTGRADLPSSEE